MRQLILKNFKIKILVVLLAVFIWFFVKTENNYTYSLKIPIALSNVPAEKLITNDIPSHVKVSVWGKGSEILSIILGRRFVYHIDLSNIKESMTIPLKKDDIRFPRASNLEIMSILKPDSIHVIVEDIGHKDVPIQLRAEIKTIPGYSVIDAGISPDTIRITGAISKLDSISSMATEALTFKKVRADIKKKVMLEKIDVDNVWVRNQDVYLIADVQKLMEKPFTNLPINIINKPENAGVTVIPSSLNLTLVGGVDVLLPLTEDSVFAYLDYEKIIGRSGEYFLAYIDKPDGVRIKGVKPERFRAIIKKKR